MDRHRQPGMMYVQGTQQSIYLFKVFQNIFQWSNVVVSSTEQYHGSRDAESERNMKKDARGN